MVHGGWFCYLLSFFRWFDQCYLVGGLGSSGLLGGLVASVLEGGAGVLGGVLDAGVSVGEGVGKAGHVHITLLDGGTAVLHHLPAEQEQEQEQERS